MNRATEKLLRHAVRCTCKRSIGAMEIFRTKPDCPRHGWIKEGGEKTVIELIFKLVRPAKSKGGDRYEAALEAEDKPFVIYLPQSISRVNDVPFDIVNVAVSPEVSE